MTSYTNLLSENLRPKSLTELALSEDKIRMFQKMVASESIMNMVFYGRPGSGKTSAARILIHALDADVYELNGSLNNGDKTMVKSIEQFASTVSFQGRQKICFIDEADFMSKTVQDPLRYVIENMSSNCRFLMTANDLGKLTPAIQSRCTPVEFSVQVKDKEAIIDRMIVQYDRKLQELGICLDQKKIYEIVSLHFPDFRKIANRFQMETLKAA